VQGGYSGDQDTDAIVLQTARLILSPLSQLDEAEHQQASGKSDAASRDTRAAALQWRQHGFGPWAIRDRGERGFLGVAELRFAGDGIDGIAPNEVEAGWWVTEVRRGQGIATEAMQAAIADLWGRAGVESLTAYIEEEDNEPSRRLAVSLGFNVRGRGRGRFGEPMTVYELRRT
jgi:RimJ/RimL family protein N-acetyltransferase